MCPGIRDIVDSM